MQDNSRKKVDALLLLAKTAIGDRRRRSWPVLLAMLAVLLIFLTVVVCLFLPKQGLPELIWPADTQVLVIDADHVLANVDEPKFWVTNNLDVRSLPGAAQDLQKARARFRVVYLSGAADRVARYNKLLVWLQKTAPASEQFPEGPLLAPASQSAVDRATFQRETLKHLRVSFTGTVVGIAGGAEESEIFQQAGLKTWQLGSSDDAPKDVTAVKSWKELETPLTK